MHLHLAFDTVGQSLFVCLLLFVCSLLLVSVWIVFCLFVGGFPEGGACLLA